MRDKFMYEAKGFQSTDFAELIRVVNDFLGSLEEGKLIDVKYKLFLLL
ncbi:sporulation protein Cse60 [Bacillus sp. ISL-57]|nr:sporulation protein Cse60 [Bacillus sp. ISL-57]